VESDDRRWSEALADRIGRPVGRFRTPDHLGAALLEFPAVLPRHLAALRSRLAGRNLVVSSEDCLRIAQLAELPVQRLSELVPSPPDARAHRPCHGAGQHAGDAPRRPGELACCGARDPLLTAHPDIATAVGEAAAYGLGPGAIRTTDSRCGRHLVRCGAEITDPVDWLLAASA